MATAHRRMAEPCGQDNPLHKTIVLSLKITLDKRRAGVLLHPTSLPSGDFGADAFRFLDLMQAAGLTVWQTLPLGPTHDDRSPYHCLSVHAINPAFVSPEKLVERGWLESIPNTTREAALAQACAGLLARGTAEDRAAFEKFRTDTSWLGGYALYQALRDEQGGRPWWQWPAELRDRDPKALEQARVRLKDRLAVIEFGQFAATQQWQALRAYANARGILLFGDMPIFVAHDSAAVWANRDCFKLDAAGQPTVVAGVPPDYFSATGQHWGNPHYDWEALSARNFDWWIRRLETEFSRFDFVRIDHFRGFEACWEIPADEKTAVNGRWVKVPGEALFDKLLAHFGRLSLVAEDLGVITPDVNALRYRYNLPGMAVLQFAFDGGPDNPYLPHNVRSNTVIYTGTHDNDTTCSWFEMLPAQQQLYVVDYLGYLYEPMPWPLIRAALMSVARLAIVPMQDLLGLGHGQRMNTPGTTNNGNWKWKFSWSDVAPDLAERMRRLVKLYGREAS